ncbi:MAG: hypothetical protein COB99_08365 [Sulfurimonas sp.]|nr:MAG: hypothetical protein COB99_08365 [Sulfurimonas sp.]
MEEKKIYSHTKYEKENFFIYDDLKRIFISIVFSIIIIFGLFLVFIENWFVVLFGVLLIIIGLLSMLDILFFKMLSFYDKYLIKEWFVFGKKKIEFDNLEAGAVKRVWTGTIIFRDKRKNSFFQFFMNFETFPIGNDGFREIRKILIDKKVIKGDENGWNY